jgi:hypothetical protein
MEPPNRKCVCCHKQSLLFCFDGIKKTCIICLENAREKYRENREAVLRRNKIYRVNNVEKEKERHKLYDSNNRETILENKQEYKYLEYYCPVCLYTIKLHRKTAHCKSILHLNNLKYCDSQKQICILNSHIENNILHRNIDEEVNILIEDDIKNNLLQQSLLDAIRNFNMKIELAMQCKV